MLCKFCQRSISKLAINELPAGCEAFQCRDSPVSSIDFSSFPSERPLRIVFCNANKSLVCTMAHKFPGRCNMSEPSVLKKFQIFDCPPSLVLKESATYSVSFPGGYYVENTTSKVLHNASFLLGGVSLVNCLVLSYLPAFHFRANNKEEVVSACPIQVESEGKVWTLLDSDPTYRFHVGERYHIHNAVQTGEDSFSLDANSTVVEPTSSTWTVEQFLIQTPVAPVTFNRVTVFFRRLKQEFFSLLVKHQAVLVVCYTGPDASFLTQLRGKCVGLVTSTSSITDFPMATDAHGTYLWFNKPAVFQSSHDFELVHSKFAVFGDIQRDGSFSPQAVWTGSFNFTENANRQCVENAMYVNDPVIAMAYQSEFLRVHDFVLSNNNNNKRVGAKSSSSPQKTAPKTKQPKSPPKKQQSSHLSKEEEEVKTAQSEVKTPNKTPTTATPVKQASIPPKKRQVPQSGAAAAATSSQGVEVTPTTTSPMVQATSSSSSQTPLASSSSPKTPKKKFSSTGKKPHSDKKRSEALQTPEVVNTQVEESFTTPKNTGTPHSPTMFFTAKEEKSVSPA